MKSNQTPAGQVWAYRGGAARRSWLMGAGGSQNRFGSTRGSPGTQNVLLWQGPQELLDGSPELGQSSPCADARTAIADGGEEPKSSQGGVLE